MSTDDAKAIGTENDSYFVWHTMLREIRAINDLTATVYQRAKNLPAKPNPDPSSEMYHLVKSIDAHSRELMFIFMK